MQSTGITKDYYFQIEYVMLIYTKVFLIHFKIKIFYAF